MPKIRHHRDRQENGSQVLRRYVENRSGADATLCAAEATSRSSASSTARRKSSPVKWLHCSETALMCWRGQETAEKRWRKARPMVLWSAGRSLCSVFATCPTSAMALKRKKIVCQEKNRPSMESIFCARFGPNRAHPQKHADFDPRQHPRGKGPVSKR